MEIARSIEITVEIDTNKRTERATFSTVADLLAWLHDNGLYEPSVRDFEIFKAGAEAGRGYPNATVIPDPEDD